MHPVEFPEQNTKFIAPGCGDLPAFSDGKHIVTCWHLDEKELAEIAQSGRIWVMIHGSFVMPMTMTTQVPIEDRNDWPDEVEETGSEADNRSPTTEN